MTIGELWVLWTVFDQAPHLSKPTSKKSSLSVPESWTFPFNRALEPWLGVSPDEHELWTQLPETWQRGQESNIRSELEEALSVPEEETPIEKNTESLPLPSTLGELQQLADGKVENLIEFSTLDDPLELLSAYIVLSWSSRQNPPKRWLL